MDNQSGKSTPPEKNKSVTWLKRLGIAGFLFFLIKGLVWIAVIYGGLHVAGC